MGLIMFAIYISPINDNIARDIRKVPLLTRRVVWRVMLWMNTW